MTPQNRSSSAFHPIFFVAIDYVSWGRGKPVPVPKVRASAAKHTRSGLLLWALFRHLFVDNLRQARLMKARCHSASFLAETRLIA